MSSATPFGRGNRSPLRIERRNTKHGKTAFAQPKREALDRVKSGALTAEPTGGKGRGRMPFASQSGKPCSTLTDEASLTRRLTQAGRKKTIQPHGASKARPAKTSPNEKNKNPAEGQLEQNAQAGSRPVCPPKSDPLTDPLSYQTVPGVDEASSWYRGAVRRPTSRCQEKRKFPGQPGRLAPGWFGPGRPLRRTARSRLLACRPPCQRTTWPGDTDKRSSQLALSFAMQMSVLCGSAAFQSRVSNHTRAGRCNRQGKLCR